MQTGISFFSFRNIFASFILWLVCSASQAEQANQLANLDEATNTLNKLHLLPVASTLTDQQAMRILQTSKPITGSMRAAAVLSALGYGINHTPNTPSIDNNLVNSLFQPSQGYYLGKLSNAVHPFDTVNTLYQLLNMPTAAPEWENAKELEQLILDGTLTGYNLVHKVINGHDLLSACAGLCIRYGHSDAKHAVQLIGMLIAHGIEGQSWLIPKTSVFQIRQQWQDEKSTSTIRHAQEYDILFVFSTANDKSLFQPLIQRYAKKNKQRSETAVLSQSWWQPFYRSETEYTGYHLVTRIRMSFDHADAVSLVLNEQAEKVYSTLKQRLPSVQISLETLWVNPAFYRYLQGDFQ